jgi:transaldolase
VSGVLPPDGGAAEKVLAEFRRAGVDDARLAARLQREGTAAFDESWKDLTDCIESKRDALTKAAAAPVSAVAQ